MEECRRAWAEKQTHDTAVASEKESMPRDTRGTRGTRGTHDTESQRKLACLYTEEQGRARKQGKKPAPAEGGVSFF